MKKIFHWMNKRDAIAIAFFLLCALGIMVLFFRNGGEKSDQVEIYVQGELYAKFDLSQDQSFTIEHDGKINELVIKDHTLKMVKASCKDQLCVHQSEVFEITGTIICLPNQVEVRLIQRENANTPDTISQ